MTKVTVGNTTVTRVKQTSPDAATQAEVDAGVITIKYVSPKTLTDWSGGGGAGDVVGPASAVDENLTVFNTTSGKLIKDGGIAVNRVINTILMGLVEGGTLSINGGDNTKFDVSAGNGIIVDNYTDANNPVAYPISWGAFTAVTPTYLATNTSSHVLIERSGTIGVIRQQATFPTAEEQRDYIYLGQLGHANLTNIAAVINKPKLAVANDQTTRDLEAFVGLINTGNVISANGANLSINKSLGYLFGSGINFDVNNKNPNIKTFSAQVAASLRRRTQTGLGATGVTVIDPANYDVGGTITAIAGTKYTNQRVFLTTAGNLVVQYGQTLYNTMSQAVAAINRESFVVLENVADNAFPIAIISVRSSATDLSNTDQASFSFPTKFGELNAAAAGISVSTLQNVYNNSVDPEILTDSTRGGLTIRRGSGADTDDIIEFQNGAGTRTGGITGEGNVIVLDEAYGVAWSGSLEVPTKNAIYGKFFATSGTSTLTGNTTITGAYSLDFISNGISGAGGYIKIATNPFAASGYGTLLIDLTNTGSDGMLTINSLNSSVTFDGIGSTGGFYYGADYSVGATDRWIPDKAYVDSAPNGWRLTGTTTLTGNATIAGSTTNAVYFGGASPSGSNELDYFGVNIKRAAGFDTIFLRSYDDEALFNNDSSLQIRSDYALLNSGTPTGVSTIKAAGAIAQIEADTINFDSYTTGNFMQLYDDGISIFRTTINSQVVIGNTTGTTNVLLDVQSTTKAFAPPRMTETQRDAIGTPSAGMVVYNTTTNLLNFYNGSAWGAV